MVVHLDKNFLNVRPLCFPDQQLIVVAYDKIVEVHDFKCNVIWKFEETSEVLKLENYDTYNLEFYLALKNGTVKVCDIRNSIKREKIQLSCELSDIFFSYDDVLTISNKCLYFYPDCDTSKKRQITDKILSHISYAAKTGIIGMVENSSLSVICLKNDKRLINNVHKWRKNYPFTSISCHPQEPMIATGDTGGHILIWYDVLNNLKQHKVLHWHFLSLKTVEFTENGNYLLSGGREHVLIKWQISNTDGDREKSVLPRMESDIEAIRSCRGIQSECFIITLADNSYKIISSAFSVIHSYSALAQRSMFLQQKVSNFCPLNPIGLTSCHNMSDKLRSTVMLNGHEGKIQLYNLIDRQINNHLDVTCQNWPTETENYLIPGFLQVRCLTVSTCGEFLATYECLAVGNEFDMRRTLKIFQFNKNNLKFKLVDRLQLDNFDNVSDMVFQPFKKRLLLVTDSLKTILIDGTDNWVIVDILELIEVLFKYQIKIDTSKICPSKLTTTRCGEDDGIVLITKNDYLIIYQWSQLVSFKQEPIVAVTVDTLTEDVDIEKELQRELNKTIKASAIFRDEENNKYRIVLGLNYGLILLEMKMSTDKSIELETLTSAISNYPVMCLKTQVGPSGNRSKVAVLYENADHLTIIDVWNDDECCTKNVPVPILDDVTWVPVNEGRDWTLIGLLKNSNQRSIIACDDKAASFFTPKIIEPVFSNLDPLPIPQDMEVEDSDEEQMCDIADLSITLVDAKLCSQDVNHFNQLFQKY